MTTYDRLPILSFPLKALQYTVKHLGFRDLLWLSQCSRECYEMVKSNILAIQRYIIMDFYFEPSPAIRFLTAERDPAGPEDFAWTFHRKYDPDRYLKEEIELKTVQTFTGNRFDCWEESEQHIGSVYDSMDTVLDFVQHMAGLFNGFIMELFISPAQIHQLEQLLSMEIVTQAVDLVIGQGTIDNDSMHRIMEGVKPDRLTIKCNIEPKFNFHQMELPTSRLKVTNCSLLDSSTTMLPKLHGVQFIWKENSDKGKMAMELCKKYEDYEEEDGIYDNTAGKENWDLKRITEGLEDIHIKPLPIPANYLAIGERFPRIFKRKTDGMVLVVHVVIHQSKLVLISLSEADIVANNYSESVNRILW